MKERVLVTGSEGYIGKQLVRMLEKRGDVEIITLDKKNGGDILSAKLPHANIVFHLAAQADVAASVKKPELDARENIMATLRLLEYYKDTDTMVFLASSAAAKDPQSPYGVSKRAVELYSRLYWNATAVRFPNVFGRGGRGVVDQFIASKGDMTVYGDGQQSRDFVHVDDICSGLIHIAFAGKDDEIIEIPDDGIFELGSGKSTTVLAIANAVNKHRCATISFMPKRDNEIRESKCENTLPGWKPQIDVLEYVENRVRFDQ